MNDEYDNAKTDKEALEKHGGVSTLNPVAREYMVAMIHKLPHTSEEELRGAQFPEEIVEEWKKVWSRPPIGKVHAATGREYRSNCSMKFFTNHSDLNEWFDGNHGYILFDWKPDAQGGIYCLIGQILSPEDQSEMEIRATVINEEVEKRKRERNERLEEYAQKLKEAQEENRRLIEVGKKCEHHHKPGIEAKRAEKKGKGK